MRSAMPISSVLPSASRGVRIGSSSDFSEKTKAESSATASCGSNDPRMFSRMTSVRISSCAVLICGGQHASIIAATHLAGDATLEEHGRVGVDEVEVLQDLHALLVLGQQL